MSISVQCPGCGKKLKAKGEMEGSALILAIGIVVGFIAAAVILAIGIFVALHAAPIDIR
jgi:hypothetical protein